MSKGVHQFDDSLGEPTEKLIDSFRHLAGDLLILGAGGKMGPTFARMARRAFEAADKRSRVLAVSRFTNNELVHNLTAHGIETISGDLFDSEFRSEERRVGKECRSGWSSH